MVMEGKVEGGKAIWSSGSSVQRSRQDARSQRHVSASIGRKGKDLECGAQGDAQYSQ